MIVAFLALVVTVAVILFVLQPLLHPDWQIAQFPERSAGEDLLIQRDRLYDEIRELEADHRLGRVGEEDFRDLHDRLELEAARTLRDLDQVYGSLDRSIEREIERVRRQGVHCSVCGTEVRGEGRFCIACGAELGLSHE